ncbi:mechanosensitive ion channel domain-containing protein [Micrococcus lylae]|uniref:Mechanosensitive ion channel n=1 Tax=Micrococcus lylae TaxID=1273 RepID=A0ABY2K2B5_9MICC|nr:mechanosensitive ion channel domain-containing protein [Micrococcus lylae]TFH99098.1 mechanosensitive ion channel [Micrococcus lylae]
MALVTMAKAPAREAAWFPFVSFLLLAAFVGCLAWAAVRAVNVVEEQVLDRYREAGVNDRRERKVRTQTVLIRRILQAVIVVVAVAVVLLTIPAVRSLGAGLLASAGLISVIAALAVQSTLTNVFAGVQLAFTDSVRVGDVVTMDTTFGTVEDITLSNVVLKLWDGRRMVYPSSQFTTQPFENWTRVGSAVSGTVEMDVDWRVPMEDLRERLKELLASTDLWDGREASMQVTDAVGGMVRIRAVVSARTSGDLWDLRCLVREDLVNFIRHDHPEAIHAQRLSALETPFRPGGLTDDDGTASASGLPSCAGSAPASSGAAPEGGSPASEERGGAGRACAGRAGTGAEEAGAVERGAGQRKAGAKDAGGDVAAAPADREGFHPPTARLPRVDGDTRPQIGAQPTAPLARVGEDTSMYTGSITAVERNREFAGPGEDAYAERMAKVRAEREEESRGAEREQERRSAGREEAGRDDEGVQRAKPEADD